MDNIEIIVMVFTLFAGSFLLIFYHYIGYPLLLNLFARHRMQVKPGMSLPFNKFIFVIPMYDEEKYISNKIANLAEIEYPVDLFEIWLLDDGSTDNTLGLATITAKKYPELTIKIKSFAINRGKVAWFNQVIPDIPEDYIVFFSDVSANLPSSVLKKANRYFNNPHVGAYCTCYKLQKNDMNGEKYYWHYQIDIKIKESKLGTPMGYHGTGYAIRKSLWKKLPQNTINDDFVLPLQAITQKRTLRGVYDSSCVSVENEPSSEQGVFSRRIRIAAGNIQQVFILFKLLSPQHGWVAWMLFSCKVLRVFMPWLMIFMLISNLILAFHGSLLFLLLLLGQIIFYASMLVNLLIKDPFTEVISYFIKGNITMLLGWVYFCQLNKTGRWKRTSHSINNNYIHPTVKVGKWLTDKLFALIGLLFLICLTPFIAIIIKISSPGPIFYKQIRVGLGTETKTKFFYLYKFRTMRINSELDGARWFTTNDPRVFWFGGLLRKIHLDELPQVINIFKGNMSLIGLRPERLDLYPFIIKKIPYYEERLFEVLPGLTGLAQVTYQHDKTLRDVKRKVALDHLYAMYLTNPWIWFKTDMSILFKTIKMILLGQTL